MIVLQTKNKAPKSTTLLVIECVSEQLSTIRLSTEEMNKRNAADTAWEPDADHMRQIVTFIDADGEPSQLVGKVPIKTAIQAEAIYKVVVEVETVVKKTAAREKGGFSGQFYALNLLRVAEVWEDAKKPIYKAAPVASAPAQEMDMSTGRIGKSA